MSRTLMLSEKNKLEVLGERERRTQETRRGARCEGRELEVVLTADSESEESRWPFFVAIVGADSTYSGSSLAD